MGWKQAIVPALRLGEGMEALESEGQPDQTPLTGGGLNTSQRELAETERLFEAAEHRLDGAFAYPLDRFA